jgi:hypothetical protein
MVDLNKELQPKILTSYCGNFSGKILQRWMEKSFDPFAEWIGNLDDLTTAFGEDAISRGSTSLSFATAQKLKIVEAKEVFVQLTN